MEQASAEQILQAATALFGVFTWGRILPLVTLVVCALLLYWMLAKAQRSDPSFKAVDFLRETDGKASWKRLTGTGCFVVHSWYLYVVTVTGKATWNDVALYVLTWSGSVVLLEGLRIFRGTPPAAPTPPAKDPE